MKLAVGIVAFAAALATAHAAMPPQLAGSWCTTKALKTSNVQALSAAETKLLEATTIQFAASEFKSGTRTLVAPRYEVKTIRASELVVEFMVLPKELGISAGYVREVEVNDQKGQFVGAPGDMVLMKVPSIILWYWKGVFFEAKRCDSTEPKR